MLTMLVIHHPPHVCPACSSKENLEYYENLRLLTLEFLTPVQGYKKSGRNSAATPLPDIHHTDGNLNMDAMVAVLKGCGSGINTDKVVVKVMKISADSCGWKLRKKREVEPYKIAVIRASIIVPSCSDTTDWH